MIQFWQPLQYLSASRTTCNAASQTVTLPTGVATEHLVVRITAEGADVRFALNVAASATSAGFVPQNESLELKGITNLTSLAVYGAVGAFADIVFFSV